MLFRLSTTCLHPLILLVAVLVVCTAGVPLDNPMDNLLNVEVNVEDNTRVMSPTEIEIDTLKQLSSLKENYSNFSASGSTVPPFLEKMLKLVNLDNLKAKLMKSLNSCSLCKLGVQFLKLQLFRGKPSEEIKRIVKDLCIKFEVQTPRVCEGVTELFVWEIEYVLEKTDLGSRDICSFVLPELCGDVYIPTHEWNVVFPSVPKPTPVEIKIPKKPVRQSKVLHLSDYHFDPYYVEGMNADCKEPLCCRLTSGPAPDQQSKAGKWGDYRNCDTPLRLVDNMLDHIAANHPDIDYIIWTGDLPAHDIWNQTREENLMILKESVQHLVTTFPNVSIFPALGNHESVPVNSFPTKYVVNDAEYNIDWLYNELDTQWRRWLPDSTSKTIKNGAFYSVLVRPGFRIISLNMNYCNNLNFWLVLNSIDPVNELHWFIDELQNAENKGEKVHVIGHIPPGNPDCLKVWSRNYYAIINRYESTITAQFFGHTHFDEFEIFYDTQNMSRPVSVAYVGPSVSSYDRLNPGYRIYYVDGDREESTTTVLDHETWVMDLQEANKNDKPIWQKMYSAQKEYNLPSLLPRDWDAFIDKLTYDEEMFDLYYKHYWKNSPVRPPCDAECRKSKICDLRSGRSHDRKTFCKNIEIRSNELLK